MILGRMTHNFCRIESRLINAQWMNKATKSSGTTTHRFVTYDPERTVDATTEIERPVLDEDKPRSPNTSSSPLGPAILRWSHDIFNRAFEAVFGLTIGKYGCPFV